MNEVVEPRVVEGRTGFVRTRYRLVRQPHEVLTLECLTYPDATETYWLDFQWHGLESTTYRLDSWRHREARVEFKYAVDADTGTGLAFVVHDRVIPPSPS